MPKLNGDIVFKPKDRLFETMWQIFQFAATLFVAQVSVLDKRPFAENTRWGHGSKLFETYVSFIIDGIVECSVSNSVPMELTLTSSQELYRSALASIDENDRLSSNSHQQLQWIDLHLFSACLIFVNFYEKHADEIRSRWGRDTKAWPDVVDFCRIVRNAVAHSGKIEFQNINYPAVRWQSLSYSPADNGRQVIGTDLLFPDIIFLMIDLSNALDRGGVPLIA